MASGVPGENENSVTLFLKYKEEFEDVISDILNNKRGGNGENPGKKCAKMKNYPDFTTPCQQVGRYLIEIKENYKHDSLKRCKYLNYRINSDENYKKNLIWFEGYKDFSSQTENICTEQIKIIQEDVLIKLKELYSYYKCFNEYKGKESDSDGTICNNIKNLYNIYENNYEKCQKKKNDPFCEELTNFKKAYDYKMSKLSPCKDLPKTLPPKEEDYLFVPILTTAMVLLMSFTIFFLYK
ncbi:PIR Superfamily Protein, partial [Plasmodium malariae]